MRTLSGKQNQQQIVTTGATLSAPLANQLVLFALAVVFAGAFYFYFYFTILRRILFLPGG